MNDDISKPTNDAYREGWERICGKRVDLVVTEEHDPLRSPKDDERGRRWADDPGPGKP